MAAVAGVAVGDGVSVAAVAVVAVGDGVSVEAVDGVSVAAVAVAGVAVGDGVSAAEVAVVGAGVSVGDGVSVAAGVSAGVASAAVAANGDADAPDEVAAVSVGGSQAASDSAKTAPIRTSAAVRPNPFEILEMMKPSVGDRFNGFRLSAISERAAAKSAARMGHCITKRLRVLSESGFTGLAGFSGFRYARRPSFATTANPAKGNKGERLPLEDAPVES